MIYGPGPGLAGARDLPAMSCIACFRHQRDDDRGHDGWGARGRWSHVKLVPDR
jgi:hypothetical protein